MTTIKKFEGKLRDSKYPEHVVNGITAILATVPFAGGIASLITDYIPSQRELRLQAFTESIANAYLENSYGFPLVLICLLI